MNAKIFCEHRWVHTHEGLHYEIIVRTSAPPTGYHFVPNIQVTYGKPFVTVLIGEEWMGDEPLRGGPEMSETAARCFVEQRLKIWQSLGLFGPHLSQEAAFQGSEALALFRNALAGVQGAHSDNVTMITSDRGNSLGYTL
jgi:hypothetical protein